MTYDPKSGPRITIVNSYEVFEVPTGGFKVLTSEGPVTDTLFPTFDGASQHARQLEPGRRR